jgi:hypothetical protein
MEKKRKNLRSTLHKIQVLQFSSASLVSSKALPATLLNFSFFLPISQHFPYRLENYFVDGIRYIT